MGKQGGKRQGAGRKKGGHNQSTHDVKELVDQIFSKVDPIKKALYLFEKGSDKTQVTLLMRLLEYRYGKPVQPIEGVQDGVPIGIQIVSHVPRPQRGSAA